MRKFRFRLQTALDQASRLEEAAKIDLAAALNRSARAQEALASLLTRRREIGETLLACQSGHLDLEEIRRLREHLEQVCAGIADQRLVVAEIQAQVEQRRLDLVERMKKRQVLERLRATRWSEHYRRETAAEAKALDDLANARYARRSLEAVG